MPANASTAPTTARTRFGCTSTKLEPSRKRWKPLFSRGDPQKPIASAGMASTISGPVIHQSDSCMATSWVSARIDRELRGSAELAMERQEEHAEGVERRQEHGDHGECEQDRAGARSGGQDLVFRPEP